MNVEAMVKDAENLIEEGERLVPLGGFDFSGYNARLQDQYLEWRKGCLKWIEETGPIGFSFKNKISTDAESRYFYQTSASLILNCMIELYEKAKSSPDLFASEDKVSEKIDMTSSSVSSLQTGGMRVIKPPPKKSSDADLGPKPSAESSSNRVYVIGDENGVLWKQLLEFLKDIGLQEVVFTRTQGKMLELDKIDHQPDIRCAFFLFNSDDLAYALFEVGHFVGKLGNGRVFVIHKNDIQFPSAVPGVSIKSVAIKIEEVSLSLLKELKACGYQLSL